jgi:putative nucleotidyltransferase with HDIG domain
MTPGLMDLTRSASSLCVPYPGEEAAPTLVLDNPAEGIRLSDIAGALSHALDITEGQPVGHAVRTTLIGMRIGSELGLSDGDRSALFYALLLKDRGCSSNSSRLAALFGADDLALKYSYKLVDWVDTTRSARYAYKHVLPGQSRMARAWHTILLGTRHKESGREMIATRCERGADIARMLSLPKATVEAIRSLDEHWDGQGMPLGLGGSAIPMLSRIVGLAQTVEVFARTFDVEAAYQMAHGRRGRWFDPVLVDCLDAFKFDAPFWGRLGGADSLDWLSAEERVVRVDEHRLDTVAEAFAKVIDAKSPFTARHSQNVAFLAVQTGKDLGMSRTELRTLRRAALLHDIGKLGVSNRILDKPSALDPVEVEAMRRHTGYSFEILSRVPRFRQFAATAAAHHEKLNGSGYHLGLKGEALGQSARVLAVADICEAMSAERPYRKGMPIETVLARLDELVAAGHLCPAATDALTGWFEGLPETEREAGESTSAAA